MSKYIAEVIRFKSDNEYKESREGGDIRSYDIIERANKYIRNYMKHKD